MRSSDRLSHRLSRLLIGLSCAIGLTASAPALAAPSSVPFVVNVTPGSHVESIIFKPANGSAAQVLYSDPVDWARREAGAPSPTRVDVRAAVAAERRSTPQRLSYLKKLRAMRARAAAAAPAAVAHHLVTCTADPEVRQWAPGLMRHRAQGTCPPTPNFMITAQACPFLSYNNNPGQQYDGCTAPSLSPGPYNSVALKYSACNSGIGGYYTLGVFQNYHIEGVFEVRASSLKKACL